MKARFLVKAVFAVLLISALLVSGTIVPASAEDRSAVEDFVTRFYNLCLGRGPDAGGLKGWVDPLFDGTSTGSDVAKGFIYSQEFIQMDTDVEEYLQVLYEAFFNRQPDPGGKQGWLDVFAAGKSREHVLEGFIYAEEFKKLCEAYGIKAFEGHETKGQRDAVAAFVTRFYDLCLGRKPDPDGLATWTDNLLQLIQTGAEVAYGFVFSTEFTEKKLSNAEFLEILYEAFFNRKPDPGGWDVWKEALDAGRHRQEVLNGFIYSDEFAKLCQLFGIKGYNSLPPPVSTDNSHFYGTYEVTVQNGSCPAETFIATVGDDISKYRDDGYVYLPKSGSKFFYAGDDDDGDYVETTINITENTMTMLIEGTYSDGSGGWVSEVIVNFAADYNSFTIGGHEADDHGGSCVGPTSGSGVRTQSTPPPTNNMYVGRADPTSATNYYDEPCSGGSVQFEIINNDAHGTFTSDEGGQGTIFGSIRANGALSFGVYSNNQLIAGGIGNFSGNTISGSWEEYEGGCVGTWSATKN